QLLCKSFSVTPLQIISASSIGIEGRIWDPGISNSGFSLHGGFSEGQSSSVKVLVDVPGS
ncbi:hypothetical protein, partial [Salmonella sp. SAL4360]|uniref:hypothetical protein n=1 Tax=Salmonella sp. SAL4360 TaxID=3159881 RepID=UPI00397C3BE9